MDCGLRLSPPPPAHPNAVPQRKARESSGPPKINKPSPPPPPPSSPPTQQTHAKKIAYHAQKPLLAPAQENSSANSWPAPASPSPRFPHSYSLFLPLEIPADPKPSACPSPPSSPLCQSSCPVTPPSQKLRSEKTDHSAPPTHTYPLALGCSRPCGVLASTPSSNAPRSQQNQSKVFLPEPHFLSLV